MARRQLYGGREADEFRSRKEAMEDRIRENEIVEGVEVAEIRRLLKISLNTQDPTLLNSYLSELGKKGFSPSRISSMVQRASARLRIK